MAAERKDAEAKAKEAGETDEVKKAKEAGETDEVKKAKEAARARLRRAKEKSDKAAELETEAKRGYFVVEGQSITSSKGPVVGGDRVTAANWGEGVLERLVASKVVKHVK